MSGDVAQVAQFLCYVLDKRKIADRGAVAGEETVMRPEARSIT
jgi:hypothetical protein